MNLVWFELCADTIGGGGDGKGVNSWYLFAGKGVYVLARGLQSLVSFKLPKGNLCSNCGIIQRDVPCSTKSNQTVIFVRIFVYV